MTRPQTNAKGGITVIALLAVIAFASQAASAHSVTTNLRFHITDVNDVNHTGSTYVSSESGGTLAALVFAGSLLTNITLDKSSDPYLLRLTQDENQNHAVIVLTNGTWQKIESKTGIPAKTFGDLALPGKIRAGFALQLQFDTLDLSGAFGPGQILIKSLGRLRLPQISIQPVG